jgi:hypothetical protein
MKLIERLLGISGQGDAYPAIVMQSEGQGVPTYTPVIVVKDADYRKGVIHFPTAEGHTNRSYIILNHEESLLPLKPKGIIQNRRVKVIDEFEYKKLRKIREFIRSEGAITFIIENLMGAMDFIKALGQFKKEFPCAPFCGSNAPGGNKNPPVKGDLLSLAVTVYDLKYAIPIFNKKRVDGMAVSITLMWPKGSEQSSQLIHVNEMHFIANSYPDNVLFVDGIKIRENSFMSNMCVSLFLSQIGSEIERRKNELSKTKK